MMQADQLSTMFRAVSPSYWRRWGGKFANPRFRPRKHLSMLRVFGHTKPHGQEA